MFTSFANFFFRERNIFLFQDNLFQSRIDQILKLKTKNGKQKSRIESAQSPLKATAHYFNKQEVSSENISNERPQL